MSTPNPARIIGAGLAIMGVLAGTASGWSMASLSGNCAARTMRHLAEGERMARIVGFQASFGVYWPYLTAKPEIEDSPMPQAAPFRLTRLYGQVNHLVIKW